jgi:outer membrane protein TolC
MANLNSIQIGEALAEARAEAQAAYGRLADVRTAVQGGANPPWKVQQYEAEYASAKSEAAQAKAAWLKACGVR